MNTDFERDLAVFLHAATPHPPADLAPPSVLTLVGDRGAGQAEVIELSASSDAAPSRVTRWLPALAAAALVVVVGGVGGVLAARDDGTPAGGGPTTPTGCAPGQLVASSDHGHETSGGVSGLATVGVRIMNSGARPCTTTLPSLALAVEGAASRPFPAPRGATVPVVIPAHGRVTITATVHIPDTCPAGQEPQYLQLSTGHQVHSQFELELGCAGAPGTWRFTLSS